MSGTEQKKIKAQLIKVLKGQKRYCKETDDFQIDNLIYNLKIIESCKADIDKRGIMVNLRKSEDEPFYQINFSVSLFHNSIKSINTILKSLGLEKQKVEAKAEDEKENALKALQDLINA